MKSFTKILVSLILVFVTVFGVACNACNEGTVEPVNEETTIKELDTYLIEKGKTEYSILMPENFTVKENEAKEELTFFFKEATGITLGVVYDNQTTYDENAKFISIGKTSVAKDLDLIPTYREAYEDGYVIKTKGNSVFLTGYTDYGTLYSVYGFLNREFNYDFYTTDCYSIDKIKNDVKLKAYDLTVVPDINTIQASYGYVMYNTTTLNRLQMKNRNEIFLYINNFGSVHNTLYFFPKDKYEERYPEFYSPDGTDICFTARGKKFEEMTDVCLAEIIEEFKSGVTGTMMFIGQQDIGKTCNCEKCQEVTEKYGAASAKGILFCNRVLEKVYDWFETSEGEPYKREFYFLLLAYEKFVNAPVTKVGDKYVVNGGLSVHENFGVMSAPIKMNYTLSKADNPNDYEKFYMWKSISNVFTLYGYDTNFANYLVPFNTFDAKQDIYKTMKDVNCISIFDEGQYNMSGLPTGWSMLKCYLESKLRWNTSLDMNYYTEKYFKGVYGEEAGAKMLSVYYSFRAHWNNLKIARKNGEISAAFDSHQSVILNNALWPRAILEGWLNLINGAVKDIEYLKTENTTKYNYVYKAIAAERASVEYMLVELHPTCYSDSDLLKLKLAFKEDATLCAISHTGEAKTISSIYTGWGV